ncbi:MAG: CocE/NonD family hydrolase [Planctomycetes bacterium]|nr:CocE/NonD family hydrolase [Planctomycetota bacterium]
MSSTPPVRFSNSLALLGLLAAPLFAQEDAPRKEVYLFRIAEQDAGREEVELTPAGWKAKGTYDLLGTKKGAYEFEFAREDGVQRWTVLGKSEDGAETGRLEAEIRDQKLLARLGAEKIEKTLDLAGAVEPFPYENLVWASFLEIARSYSAAAAAGTLSPGDKRTAVLASAVTTFDVVLNSFSRETLGVGDKEGTYLVLRLTLAEKVETILASTPEGLPVRIGVPSQKVDVVLSGYESIEVPEPARTSPLDSGEWRKLLSAPEHEVVAEKGVRVPMKDGVKLAADVYRPAGEGKFPAVLVRTPYNRTTDGLLRGAFFARRGYALVSQDVRGRFESEGDWFPFRNETADGSDTIDWIAAQPWSDGNVGMIGGSYVGIVQWYAARSGNPHLKAIVPMVSPPDPDQNIPYEGGAFLLSTAWWAKILEVMEEPGYAGGLPEVDWLKALATLPLSELDTALGTKHPFVDEWLAHPPTDEAYWKPFRYQDRFGEMDVAALHISGWYDGDQPGATQNFPGMRAGAKTETARGSQFLVMGPWGHAFNSARKLGEVDFGPEGVVDLDSVVLRFFDRYLKGVQNGIDREDPVFVFVMGENRWRREKDWPLPGTVPTRLYLAGGPANKIEGGGRLALDGPADDGASPNVYRYDPADIPPTTTDFDDVIGNSATADQSVLADREDALDYTSPPLAGPVELTGPFRAVLSVSTDAPDTDFAIGIYGLAPGGKLRMYAGGIQRLRYRKPGEDSPAAPGEIVQVEIDCWATGLRFEKGDRIRVIVSSTGFPGYARNLNSLEPLPTAKEPRIAENKVHHDPAHASWLEVPFVPREGAQALAFEEGPK